MTLKNKRSQRLRLLHFCISYLHFILLFGFSLIQPDLASANLNSCHTLFTEEASFLNDLEKNLSEFKVAMGLSSVKPIAFERSRDVGPFNSISSFGLQDIRQTKTQFILSPHEYNAYSQSKKTIILPEFQSKNDYPEFRGQKLRWVDKAGQEHFYRLMNIGLSQLKRDWPILESIVEEALKKHPATPLLVTIPEDMVAHKKRLEGWQKWASLKVTDTYKSRKKYLNQDDLFGLRDFDLSLHRNDEYFVLLKDNSVSSYAMTPEQFNKDALAVVRLAKLDQHSGLIPRAWWKATDEHLPVTARFNGTSVGQLLYQSFNRLNKSGLKRVAEISRLVRFQDFPEPLMDAFLMNLLEAGIKKEDHIHATDPIDAFVISVDRATRRLFKSKYRFQDLGRLNSKGSQTEEFLMVLKTNSAEFHKTYTELLQSSFAVQKKPTIQSFEDKKGYSPWRNPEDWHQGSDLEKENLVTLEIMKARTEFRSRFLTSIPLITSERAKQIATWVATEQKIPQVLKYKLDRLSPIEKEDLFYKGIFFSTLFSQLIKRISSSFSTDGRLLIVSDSFEPFQSLISPQLGGRDVQVVSSSKLKILQQEEYDTVIVFGASDAALYEKAYSHLRSKGEFISFRHYTNPFKFNLLKTLVQYAEDLIKNEAPLTESELALELAQRRIFHEMANEAPQGSFYDPTANDAPIYFGISTNFKKP